MQRRPEGGRPYSRKWRERAPGAAPHGRAAGSRGRWFTRMVLGGLALVVAGGIAGQALIEKGGAATAPATFACAKVKVIDGDTLNCDGRRIRLQGIDAPEKPGHCRPGRTCTPGDPYASTRHLRQLTRSHEVSCRAVDTDAYGRTVARCSAGGRDLSCAQLEGGFAVRRYGIIGC